MSIAKMVTHRGDGRKRRVQTLSSRLSTVQARRVVFFALAVSVFLFGGASRTDVQSLVLLRPLSILACGYALLVLDLKSLDQLRAVSIILLALCATAFLQLIPLPASLWQALPGRELIADIDGAVGLEGVWRPATLSPSRTANMLFSLGVPIAALLIYAALLRDRRSLAVRILLWAGFASTVLAIFQLVGPANGPLYTYRITNGDAPVGLFANRNHNAIFLASLIPLIGFTSLRVSLEMGNQKSRLYQLMAIGSVLVVIPLILIGGSRAGAIAALLASIISVALWLLLLRRARKNGSTRDAGRTNIVALLAVAGVAALALVTFLTSRSVTLDRIFGASLSGEMRAQLVPLLWEMVKAYFPVGTGFGTFEAVYKIHEPASLLNTRYLNQAHNDLMQFVIEAGLPGVLILVGGLGWFLWAGIAAWRRAFSSRVQHGDAALPLFAWISLAVILSGSLLDYPLRTPAMMFTAVLLCCLVTGRTRPAFAS